MKFLHSLLAAVICLTVIFSACKKDDVFTDRLSSGTLKDSSGNCLPSSVHGVYNSGVTLLVEHYIDVHVNVDSVGSYLIATDSINGYSFKGTGTFGVKGDNLVRLYGHGTPLFGGVNVFTVRYGSSACTVAVTVRGSVAVPAVFTLNESAGACPGATLEGTFSSNIPATSANKAKLGVVVTTPGTYSITTTAVNGVSFSGTGAFTTTGPQTLVLTANGTPIASGAFNYTATVNGVSCTYSVTVADGPAAAVFTLGGSPADCTGFLLAGAYQAGTGLTSSNTVTFQVNVTTAGAYSLSTNSVNGISFSGSGTFTTTGSQTVALTATGTPIAAGNNTFTVTAGSGTCTFSVTTAPGTVTPPVVNNDYYPLTQNSYWTYDEVYPGSTGDTLKLAVNGTGTFSGNSYTRMITTFPDASTDTIYARKSGNEYHAWTYTDQFTYSVFFDVGTYADIIFLKEGPTGTTWTSATYSGTESGVATSLKYVFTISNGSTSITTNGVTFSNVIKVTQQTQVSIMGSPFSTIETVENYYAKGIGLVYAKTVPTGSTTPEDELSIRHYQVN
ncbi:hypothetical protein LK994_06885 [Ferruginibacter lapsinanis]|uniref:hypothetical protein n=1 Tax=Ferruginibacter lapsinanis TaxID=563172 RepID=UPI001E584B79|nr:hypothetical protein [Ferruginibacter lapsinanis]UEG51198.1 hypothetical protein LK994_06885 [Ferruginibacter lapsinanis]